MQVERVSRVSQQKGLKSTPSSFKYFSRIADKNRDCVSFGREILLRETEDAISTLMHRLCHYPQEVIRIKTPALGEITAQMLAKVGNIEWTCVLRRSQGKGKNRQIHTYLYLDDKVAKEERIGHSSRFIEGEKFDDAVISEWNSSVQEIASALFRHLPQ